jgi:hypothetical protein
MVKHQDFLFFQDLQREIDQIVLKTKSHHEAFESLYLNLIHLRGGGAKVIWYDVNGTFNVRTVKEIAFRMWMKPEEAAQNVIPVNA